MNNNEEVSEKDLDRLCDNFTAFVRENQYVPPKFFIPTLLGMITEMALILCNDQKSFESVFEMGVSAGCKAYRETKGKKGEKHD